VNNPRKQLKQNIGNKENNSINIQGKRFEIKFQCCIKISYFCFRLFKGLKNSEWKFKIRLWIRLYETPRNGLKIINNCDKVFEPNIPFSKLQIIPLT
jgi:hypothetical protein